MKRFFAFALVFACGLTVGHFVRPRAKAESPPPKPVVSISVLQPDPTDPTGFKSVRLRVTHTGDNERGAGVQQPNEWGVVLWMEDTTPSEHEAYFGVPVD